MVLSINSCSFYLFITAGESRAVSVYNNYITCVFLNVLPCQRNKFTLKLDLMRPPKIDIFDSLIFMSLERLSDHWQGRFPFLQEEQVNVRNFYSGDEYGIEANRTLDAQMRNAQPFINICTPLILQKGTIKIQWKKNMRCTRTTFWSGLKQWRLTFVHKGVFLDLQNGWHASCKAGWCFTLRLVMVFFIQT